MFGDGGDRLIPEKREHSDALPRQCDRGRVEVGVDLKVKRLCEEAHIEAKDDYKGIRPLKGRVKTFDDLHRGLFLAREHYDKPDGKRDAIFSMIMDIFHYLENRGINANILAPLAHVARAVAEAKQGIEDETFKPVRPSERHGRFPMALEGRILRGQLAALAEEYLAKTKRSQKVLIRLGSAATELKQIGLTNVSASRLQSCLKGSREGAADEQPKRSYLHSLEWIADINESAAQIEAIKPLLAFEVFAHALVNTGCHRASRHFNAEKY